MSEYYAQEVAESIGHEVDYLKGRCKPCENRDTAIKRLLEAQMWLERIKDGEGDDS